MTFNLQGKKIIVTGAGRGIGRDIAEKLYEQGAIVLAISRTKSYLDELKAKCPTVEIYSVDLENWDETRKVVQSIGPVHGVVNNAAYLNHAPLLDCKPEVYDKQWKTNVGAVLNICQVVVQNMIKTNTHGSIVNVSSNVVNVGTLSLALYASTKAALDRLTKSMAVEWGQHGIRANTVNPSITETDMAQEFMKNEAACSEFIGRTPIGRLLKVEDVTHSVLFLLSDLSAMITGESISIDGGYKCF